MLALGLEELLLEAGFEVAGMAARLAKALQLIEQGGCEAAIVDANLAGVSSAPAGKALAAKGIPFVVMSGYSPEQLADAFPQAAIFLQKPCRAERLITSLRGVLAQR